MTDTTYAQYMERIHRAQSSVELTAIAQELRTQHGDDPRRADIGEAIAQRRILLTALK